MPADLSSFETPYRNTMNQQGVSQIFFEETYNVPADQTARSLFSRLPHGRAYAEKMIECLATAYLLAVVESICIREMQMHVDEAAQVVVGRCARIEHRGSVPPGAPLRLRGWVEGLGGRSVTFRVQAFDDHELVCEASITLVVMKRASMESRIAAKVGALGFASGEASPSLSPSRAARAAPARSQAKFSPIARPLC